MEFLRRIGPDPHANGDKTPNSDGCPDIWEMSNGEIAVIGRRETLNLKPSLPATAGCGLDEEIVILPRETVLKALGGLQLLQS